MAAYTPPVGVADLHITGDYAPPVGQTDLALAESTLDRTLTGAAGTASPAASGALARSTLITGAAVTPAPTAAGTIRHSLVLTGAAITVGPVAAGAVSFDINIPSAYTAVAPTRWKAAQSAILGAVAPWQPALHHDSGGVGQWRDAAGQRQGALERWQTAQPHSAPVRANWLEAVAVQNTVGAIWQQSTRALRGVVSAWQDSRAVGYDVASRFRARLPLLTPHWEAPWQPGRIEVRGWRDRFQDGSFQFHVDIEIWQQAGYPGNAPHPGPPLPPPPAPHQWGTDLQIRCPLSGTALRIGRTPCVLIAEREIQKRRTYMSSNSVSLVRWPDLVPLPCIDIIIETDFESWCWALSATLAGPEVWALVQPDPLACQVQATINGQEWRFLLDVPSTQRSFNSDRVSLKGRSRSAWLQAPYASQQDFSEANAREMQQLAEAALENTGWTVDWQLDNWVVPAGLWTQYSTPLDVLIRLATATDDGVYTDPTEPIIKLHQRWPMASWLLDAATVDLLIPEDAVISLSQSPIYTQPINGVYVSGTTHGALALVKIAGTDGTLQPAAPLTEALLCDVAGVAARRRGLNALSDSGAGFEMDAEVLFAPEIGLVRPGMVVSIAGLKGISRSCRISAQWSGDSLLVRQSIGLERREVEA